MNPSMSFNIHLEGFDRNFKVNPTLKFKFDKYYQRTKQLNMGGAPSKVIDNLLEDTNCMYL